MRIGKNIVYYRVHGYYVELFDYEKIERSIEKIVQDTLGKYGVKSKKSPMLELGAGGGLEPLWDMVKTLYENKEYIGLLLAPLKWMYRFKNKIISYTQKLPIDNPIIGISLAVDLDFEYENDVWPSPNPKEILAVLYRLSYEIVRQAEKQYPLFEYSSGIGIQNRKINFSAQFSLPKPMQKFNRYRYLKHIEDLNIRPNMAYQFLEGKMYTIKRLQQKMDKIDPYFYVWMDNPKTYFFFISRKTLIDRIIKSKLP